MRNTVASPRGCTKLKKGVTVSPGETTIEEQRGHLSDSFLLSVKGARVVGDVIGGLRVRDPQTFFLCKKCSDPGGVRRSWNIFVGGPGVSPMQSVNGRGYCDSRSCSPEVAVVHEVGKSLGGYSHLSL